MPVDMDQVMAEMRRTGGWYPYRQCTLCHDDMYFEMGEDGWPYLNACTGCRLKTQSNLLKKTWEDVEALLIRESVTDARQRKRARPN